MCCLNPKKKCIHGDAGVEVRNVRKNLQTSTTLRALVRAVMQEKQEMMVLSIDPEHPTRSDFARVNDAWSAGEQTVVSVQLAGYQVPILTLTPDHPVLTKTRGAVEVGMLKHGDYIASPAISGILGFVEIDRVEDAPACEVFGLELVGRLWFPASGIFVGSLNKP
jgi:hypothetical protein